MPRLFTGLEIPEEIQQSLSLLRGGLPGARWIDPENYHITLRFIGDIDDRLAHEIASILDGMRRRSFEVRLSGVTSFGGKKPRAIVVAIEPVQPLIELQAEQERLMQRLGLEPDGRKFTPHITLARLRDSSSHDVAEYLSTRGPLFGNALFRASDSRFFWYARYHHIVMDAFGMWLIARHVADVYTQLSASGRIDRELGFGRFGMLLERDAAYRSSAQREHDLLAENAVSGDHRDPEEVSGVLGLPVEDLLQDQHGCAGSARFTGAD